MTPVSKKEGASCVDEERIAFAILSQRLASLLFVSKLKFTSS
jgi:hypothetical protein